MITEVSPDLFDISLNKSSKGVKIQNIFSKSLISTAERAKLVKNESYKKLVQNQLLERKVKNKLDILINLNEKEHLDRLLSLPE